MDVTAELQAAQASCQPNHPLADIAIVTISLGEPNSLFTPIKPPPSEEAIPQPAAVPAAPAAKAPAKAPAAKAPAGKAPAGKGAAAAAAAAADQEPPMGAPELGRALELLGSQVQDYYGWREGAAVRDLPDEPLTADDLTVFKAVLQDAPKVSEAIQAFGAVLCSFFA